MRETLTNTVIGNARMPNQYYGYGGGIYVQNVSLTMANCVVSNNQAASDWTSAGGGIAANVARVLPVGIHAEISRATWTPPPIFGLIGALGGVALAAAVVLTVALSVGVALALSWAVRLVL